MNATEKKQELEQLQKLTRVNRDEIIKYFQNKTGFASLPVHSPEDLTRDNRIRYSPKGWIIPATCYGRANRWGGLRESMRSWILRNLSHYIPDGETIMVAYEDDDLKLYRRKKNADEMAER